MKTLELYPTDENVLSTYLSDSIGRNKDIFHFVNILNSLEGSYSISLDGKWGSGKTFFVKQTKMVLEANNDFVESMLPERKRQIKEKQYSFFRPDETLIPQVCVYYDAWENDSDSDPILSLVYTIMQSVSDDFDFTEHNYLQLGTAVLEVVGKMGWGGFPQNGVSALGQFSGSNWDKIINGLKGENPLATLKKDKTLHQKINDFLDSLLPEKGNRLIIFVDELDRCSPEYAVRLLERIKHYFSNKKITFVFSVNLSELQHTIKRHYGESFDGYRYLNRFFNLPIELPSVDFSKYYSQIGFYSTSQVWEIVFDALVKNYHMQLREISQYYQLCRLTIGNYLDEMEKKHQYFMGDERYYCLMYVVPIMVALKIVSVEQYNNFISGNDGTPLVEISGYLSEGFFSKLLGADETFDPATKNENLKGVSLNNKLESLYNALFKTDYEKESRFQTIGRAHIDKGLQELVKRVISLLSDYARLDGQ